MTHIELLQYLAYALLHPALQDVLKGSTEKNIMDPEFFKNIIIYNFTKSKLYWGYLVLF